MGGVDEHALCHSGVTPRRAAAAARNSAGGAIPCARKPATPELMPDRNDWGSAMANLVRGTASGSDNPRRPALWPAAAAGIPPMRRLIARHPDGRGARQADGGFSQVTMYIVKPPATMPSSVAPSSIGLYTRAGRGVVTGLGGAAKLLGPSTATSHIRRCRAGPGVVAALTATGAPASSRSNEWSS